MKCPVQPVMADKRQGHPAEMRGDLLKAIESPRVVR
jgi:hypothetical protein